MRPTVTTIESNLKGGVAITLSPRTLILGPNGAGKDAILNTVALALTGIADDVIGRDVVKDPALITTLGDGSGVVAKARLSTGTLCEYEAARTPDGTAKKPVQRNTYPDAYPLRTVRDALTASADKARAFLLAQVASTITDADVDRALPVEALPTYHKLVANALGATPVDRLLSVHATAKKRAADAATQADGLETSIRRTADTLGPEPLTADVAGARALAEAARAAFLAVSSRPDVRALHKAVIDTVLAYQAAKREADAARAAAGSDADTAIHRVAQMDGLRLSARWHVDRASDACALCGSHVAGGADTFAARLRDIEHAHGVWTQRASAGVTARTLEENATRLRDAATRALDAFEAVGGASAIDTPNDAATLSAAYETAQADLIRIEQAASAWATVRAFRSQQAGLVAEARDLKALREGTTNAIANLLDRAVEAFAARVQRYLPPSDTFALRLRDGDREVCRFGFLRDGQLHAALSGAEWSRCLTAIAAAVAEGVNVDHPVLLVPPERAFDPATLAAVLDAWRDAPGQVLVASPVAPAYLPDGWTVVALDGAATLPPSDGPTATADGDKPKRKRRTKAEMEAARAAERMAGRWEDPVKPDATPNVDGEAPNTTDGAPNTTPSEANATPSGAWFDASALTETAPVTVAATPDVVRYAPNESADEVAAFFARLRGVAEAK